ncbi:4Fe-4S dicluster domain-containing protein [Fretibacterium sp. OH1220_COT-178]|nr:4Fe-4S dicluster domain-containing protein [Fretibacterium sp. OH1220_COT-178]
MKVEVRASRCKQCELCIHSCPRKAIRQATRLNEQGYRPVEIDDALCIGCGICYMTCPDGVYHVLGSVGSEGGSRP